MNLLRKTATTLGGIFLAVLLFAALAPKATRGIAAALVQVTNTASNAVPTEDGPGNFPFAATLCAGVGTNSPTCATSVSAFLVPLTTSTGAAVKRLVIEDVSAFCFNGQGDAVFPLIAVPLPADSVGFGELEYAFPTTLTGSVATAHSPARIYADPGAQISPGVSGFISDTGDFCILSLTGHLETK
jgi:hypothetical protein